MTGREPGSSTARSLGAQANFPWAAPSSGAGANIRNDLPEAIDDADSVGSLKDDDEAYMTGKP